MKKRALFAGLIAALILAVDFLNLPQHCTTSTCAEKIDFLFLSWFLFTVLCLIFICILIFFNQKIQEKWWKFARVTIPLSLVAITAVVAGVLHGGTAGSAGLGGFVNNAFDRLAMGIIYGLFSLGSLIQIIRGYLRK